MSADNFVGSSDECFANAKASLFLASGNHSQPRSDGCSNESYKRLSFIENFAVQTLQASLPMLFCFN